jgi:hypothetical protein
MMRRVADHESASTYLAPSQTPRGSLFTLGVHGGRGGLLADEQHIDCAKVKIVKERESRETVVCWMLASIELQWVPSQLGDSQNVEIAQYAPSPSFPCTG